MNDIQLDRRSKTMLWCLKRLDELEQEGMLISNWIGLTEHGRVAAMSMRLGGFSPTELEVDEAISKWCLTGMALRRLCKSVFLVLFKQSFCLAQQNMLQQHVLT